MAKARDYKKEYRDYHGKPKARRINNLVRKARRKVGLKPGDPREVVHKKALSNGGSNALDNLRIVSRKTNRKKGSK